MIHITETYIGSRRISSRKLTTADGCRRSLVVWRGGVCLKILQLCWRLRARVALASATPPALSTPCRTGRSALRSVVHLPTILPTVCTPATIYAQPPRACSRAALCHWDSFSFTSDYAVQYVFMSFAPAEELSARRQTKILWNNNYFKTQNLKTYCINVFWTNCHDVNAFFKTILFFLSWIFCPRCADFPQRHVFKLLGNCK